MKKIIDIVDKLSPNEGYNSTNLSEIGIYRASSTQERAPLLYNQGVLICVQGEKNIYLEESLYKYDKDNYLVVTVPLPIEYEIILDDNKPLLAINVDINIQLLNKIIHLMGQSIDYNKFSYNEKESGLYTSRVNTEFQEIVYRLLKVLQSKEETNVLGKGIYQELIYYILKSRKSAPLYALTAKNSKLSKVEMALKEIHNNFSQTIQVEDLAKIVSMSTSSFHYAFKEVTSSTPIQYIKKIRLNKARNYIIQDGLRVNEAASKVGYESVSQFSREFKRYYGASPKEFS
ncbi:MAG: AraC family transcriptional regulator [Spirochaetaceae bacterium]